MAEKSVVEKSISIAKFMDVRETEYTDKYYHPVTRERIKSRDKKVPCFSFSEEHEIVQELYTDVPGYDWDYDDDENRYLLFANEELKYSTSWNWLIPVCKRAYEIAIAMGAKEWCPSIKDAAGSLDIKKAFDEIFRFVEWYGTGEIGKQKLVIKRIHVVGRRWFQKTYGNTYNTVRYNINDGEWIELPRTYGYGDYYIQRVQEDLVKKGLLPKKELSALWSVCDDMGIKLITTVHDVPRQRDL